MQGEAACSPRAGCPEEEDRNATEVVPDDRSKVRRRGDEPDPAPGGGGGSAGRAAAGLLRIGNAVSAAVGNRRTIEPVETRIMLAVAIALLIVATLMIVFRD
jgi:cardiolipin synthase A/B